jgi:hypothetical protein
VRLGANVTRSRQPSDGAADGDTAFRARRGARRLLTRVLPGGVMVAAALTLPELSVGAGDTGRGPAAADPPLPSSQTGPGRAARVSGTGKGSLAGVRYGGLLEVRKTVPASASRDDLLSQPADLAAPHSGSANARGLDAGRRLPAAADELDRAATYAASVLTDFAAPPGLPLDTVQAVRTPVPSPETDALDRAAMYSASVIETFVEQAAPRPATAATAPSLDGGALSATAPSPVSAPASIAPQAVAAPVRAVLPAGAPASAGGGATTAAPPPVAASAPLVAPRPGAPTASRSMIEQVTPARIAAARAAPASAPAPVPAAAAALPAAKPAPLAAAAPKAPAPAPLPAAVAAAVPKPAPALSAPASSSAPPRIEAPAFSARLLTRIDGRAQGQVDFQQTPAGLKVRLGSVAEVLADRLPASELARIRGSAAGNAWLSLAELQAQGIPISYDPVYDEFNIGREDTRPKAARKVHIDQISTPERGAGAGTMDQIRRR